MNVVLDEVAVDFCSSMLNQDKIIYQYLSYLKVMLNFCSSMLNYHSINICLVDVPLYSILNHSHSIWKLERHP